MDVLWVNKENVPIERLKSLSRIAAKDYYYVAPLYF